MSWLDASLLGVPALGVPTPGVLALGLLGLGVLLVATELVLRVLLPRTGRFYIWPPGFRARYEIDTAVLPQLEPVARWSINRDGERGPEPPADPRDAWRALVVGGSAAECYMLDQDAQWAAVVQRELSRPEHLAALGARSVHVGNVSRSLVACEYIDWMLSKVLDRYERLDCLLFMVGASDVVSWLELGTPRTLPANELDPDVAFGRHPLGPFGWSPKKLALRRVLSAWKRSVLKPIDVRTGVGKRLALAREWRANATELIDDVPDPAPMLDRFDRWFRRAVERAQRHAQRVVVLRQPWLDRVFTPAEARQLWNFGVGRPMAGNVTRYFTHRVVRELMELVDARAAAIADELGVEQLDLRPLLPMDFDTWYDFLHCTPKGCRDEGEAIARYLVEHAASPAPARV